MGRAQRTGAGKNIGVFSFLYGFRLVHGPPEQRSPAATLKKRMKIAVVMMFRNEADILGRCLQRWQDLGATHFYLCNNDSDDDSAYIANQYATYLHYDPRTNYPQAEITNGLIQLARTDGCEWIFPSDADEFLILPEKYKTLPEWLSSYPDNGPAYGELQWLNIAQDGENKYQNWHEPHRKVFGRFAPHWSVSIGNHLIYNGGNPTLGSQGAYYAHYIIRGYEHFRMKTIRYMEAFNEMNMGHHYRDWYKVWKQEGESFIQARYQEIINDAKQKHHAEKIRTS